MLHASKRYTILLSIQPQKYVIFFGTIFFKWSWMIIKTMDLSAEYTTNHIERIWIYISQNSQFRSCRPRDQTNRRLTDGFKELGLLQCLCPRRNAISSLLCSTSQPPAVNVCINNNIIYI